MKLRTQGPAALLAGLLLGALMTTAASAADTASGSIDYKGRTAAIKYVWLVSGPSDMEPGKTVRHLIASATDIGTKVQACKTLSCTDSDLTEGMTVDFTGGPRLNYWVVLNGQKIQYSGTAKPETFASRANDPNHLAGRIAIDDTSFGGPKIDIQFDVTLVKEFKSAR